MREIQTDVCVIAAGPAGLAAAITAAEDGAKVVVLEKAHTTGGAANMGMGPLGIGSQLAKRKMVDLNVEKAFKIFMDYTHWQVDARLVREYLGKSGDTIAWLEDMGVEFYDVEKYFPASQATWHVVKPETGEPGPRAASAMVHAMTRRLTELEGEVLLDTPAKSLIKEGDRVVGVLAQAPDGELTVRCKAVVVATGGCGDNPEMMEKYTGYVWGRDVFNFRIPGINGDGIRMAWEAGAAGTDIKIEMAYTVPALGDTPFGDMLFHQPKTLVVNQGGERFMNEELLENVTYAANAIARQQNCCAYIMLDHSVLRYYSRNGLDLVSNVHGDSDLRCFEEEIQRLLDAGNKDIFMADSLEDLAAQMDVDVDTLLGTVDDYNYGCEEKDDLFFKARENLMPMSGTRYYAAKAYPGGYGTLGGIKVNYKTEVLNKDFKAIGGLYAAGTDACSIFGDSYVFVLPGNTMGFALNSGRIAGEHAASFAVDQD